MAARSHQDELTVPAQFVGLRDSGLVYNEEDEEDVGLIQASTPTSMTLSGDLSSAVGMPGGRPASLASIPLFSPVSTTISSRRRSWSYSKSDAELLHMIRASGGYVLPVQKKGKSNSSSGSGILHPSGSPVASVHGLSPSSPPPGLVASGSFTSSPSSSASASSGSLTARTRSTRSPSEAENPYQRFFDPKSIYTPHELSDSRQDGPNQLQLFLSNMRGQRLPNNHSLSLEVSFRDPNGRALFSRSTNAVKKSADPVWDLSLSGVALPGMTNTAWLKGSKMTISCLAGKSSRIGAVSLDLYTLATGPPSYDLPLLDDNGQPQSHAHRARILFHARIVQMGLLSINLRNCWATGIRPSSDQQEHTNPKLVAFLVSPPDALPDDEDPLGVQDIFRSGLVSNPSSSSSSSSSTPQPPPATTAPSTRAAGVPRRPDERTPTIESPVLYNTVNPHWGDLLGGPVTDARGQLCSLSTLLQSHLVVRLYHVRSAFSTSAAPLEFLGGCAVPLSKFFEPGSTSVDFEQAIVFRNVSYGTLRGKLVFDEATTPCLAPMESGVMSEEGVHDAKLLTGGLPVPHRIPINYGAQPLHAQAPTRTGDPLQLEKVQLQKQRRVLVELVQSGTLPEDVCLAAANRSRKSLVGYLAESTPRRAVKFLTHLLSVKSAKVVAAALHALVTILENYREAQKAYLESPNAIALLNQFTNVGLRSSQQWIGGDSLMLDLAKLIGILALYDSVAQQRLADGGVVLVLKDILVSGAEFSEPVHEAAVRAIGNLCYCMGGRLVCVGVPDAGPAVGTSHNSDTVRSVHCAEHIIQHLVGARTQELRETCADTIKTLLENPENRRVALPMLGELLHADTSPSTQKLALTMMMTVIGDTSEPSSALLSAVGIESFVRLLLSSDASLRAMSTALLKQHALENAEARGFVQQSLLESGVDGLKVYAALLDADADASHRPTDAGEALSPQTLLLALGILRIGVENAAVADCVNEALFSRLLTRLKSPSEAVAVVVTKILTVLAARASSLKGIALVPLAITTSTLGSDGSSRALKIACLRLNRALVMRINSRLREVKSSKITGVLAALLQGAAADQDYQLLHELLGLLCCVAVGHPDNQLAMLSAGMLGTLQPLVVAALTTAAGPATSSSALRSAVAQQSCQLFNQLVACIHPAAAPLLVDAFTPELEEALVGFVLNPTGRSVRLNAEAFAMFRLVGYESSGLCHSKMSSPPADAQYTYCRQCLWTVCPACRDNCHRSHNCTETRSKPAAGCGCSDSFCRIKQLKKTVSQAAEHAAASTPVPARKTSKWNQECPICFDGIKNVMLYSCGHVASCENCAQMFIQARQSCPICHQEIKAAIRIYHS